MGIGSSRRVAPGEFFSTETMDRMDAYNDNDVSLIERPAPSSFHEDDVRAVAAFAQAHSHSIVQAAEVAQRRHSTTTVRLPPNNTSGRERRASQERIESRNLATGRARPGSAHATPRVDTQHRFTPFPAGVSPHAVADYGSRGSGRLSGSLVDDAGNMRDANAGGFTTESARGAVEAALILGSGTAGLMRTRAVL